MNLSALTAISPIDGRYRSKTEQLDLYFSEFGLIKYRLVVEIEYFIALCNIPLQELADFDKSSFTALRNIYQNFTTEQAERIKEIEAITNHDVKAVEYFIKEELERMGMSKHQEFIHFGLTSQDINNTAIPLSIKHSFEAPYKRNFEKLIGVLEGLAKSWDDIPMLARTHGQAASPTRLGKEIRVFIERLEQQYKLIANIPWTGKFGGATGNFNAHKVAYPDIDWPAFADEFLSTQLGIDRSSPTTQIEHYDHMAALFHNLARINTVLIDFCRDMWHYISIDYFKQKVVPGEIGSSAMPHKINPIDFENAEGNLGMANAIFEHLAAKLPISRLQRDLTDSTVLRNIGVPMAHSILAMQSLTKGLNKLVVNTSKFDADLEANWMVVAEGLQTVLRREGYPKPYEALKDLTRNNEKIGKVEIQKFIDSLDISDELKAELKEITPQNYTGT